MSQDRTDLLLKASFARIGSVALGVAVGCVGALLVFAMTAVLLLKGAPPGEHPGTHLGLLANFLPGYSVTWTGSVVGLVYGFLIGLVAGGGVAIIWNFVHHLRLMLLGTRGTVSTEP